MGPISNYEAFRVPGLDHDIDRDKSLQVGFDWLSRAESDYDGRGVIVMYAKAMMDNAPLIRSAATRWEFVSPRSRRPGGRRPVLCIWPPDDRVLELAEGVAVERALCVIPGSLYDLSAWMRRTGARCLIEGFDIEQPTDLPEDVARMLDSSLFSVDLTGSSVPMRRNT